MAVPIGTDTWKCSSSMIVMFAMIGMQNPQGTQKQPISKAHYFILCLLFPNWYCETQLGKENEMRQLHAAKWSMNDQIGLSSQTWTGFQWLYPLAFWTKYALERSMHHKIQNISESNKNLCVPMRYVAKIKPFEYVKSGLLWVPANGTPAWDN